MRLGPVKCENLVFPLLLRLPFTTFNPIVFPAPEQGRGEVFSPSRLNGEKGRGTEQKEEIDN